MVTVVDGWTSLGMDGAIVGMVSTGGVGTVVSDARPQMVPAATEPSMVAATTAAAVRGFIHNQRLR